jgi:hypothetical protein
MMDKLERMLKHLPRPAPAADLAVRITLEVHQRHVRRTWLRRGFALAFALSGLALASPAFVPLLGGWSSPGAPWLVQSVDLLGAGSLGGLAHAWEGMLAMQFFLGSSVAISSGIGLALMTVGLFFGVDRRVFHAPLNL